MKETIRKSLIHWRTKNNLTQGQLSDSLTCCRSTYQSYEDGRASPSVKILIELCQVYQLDSINDLIFYEHQVGKQKELSKKDILFDRYIKSGKQNRKIIDYILDGK